MRARFGFLAPAMAFVAAAAPALAETAFANRSFDIRFREVQETDDPARPQIPQDRRTRIHVGTLAAATRITRNWTAPPPALEHLEASGALGDWVSLQGRARLQHKVDGKTLTQTVLTSSFASRLVIELDGDGCKARIENVLSPGESYFRMRNIALGTPMRILAIRIEGTPVCAMSEEHLW